MKASASKRETFNIRIKADERNLGDRVILDAACGAAECAPAPNYGYAATLERGMNLSAPALLRSEP